MLTAMKMNELELYTRTWMNLKNTLSKGKKCKHNTY